MLWTDKGADGLSATDELRALSSSFIVEIDVTPKKSPNKFDKAGNWMPYWSWVTTEVKKGPEKIKMVDVYFLEIN